MRDKTTRGLLGTAMLCGVLAFGCGAQVADGNTVECSAHEAPIEQVECYANAATQAGHPRSCLEATDTDVSHQCLAILAGRLQDATLCDDIPTSSAESRALRETCLSEVADVLDQGILCSRIDTPRLRDTCLARIES